MSWILGALGLGWILLHLKTSRPDGTLVRGIHPYRRAMQYILPSRNGAVVYSEAEVPVAALQAYLAEAGPAFGARLTHCLVAAFAVALTEQPRMNRFVVGRRLYQRDHLAISFSMKRDLGDHRSKLAVVKQIIAPGTTFRGLVEAIDGRISENRSAATTQEDRELNLFARLPRPLMRLAVALVAALDYYNLLPGFFIRGESLYTSVFIANLGSLGMGAGYHHLFEFGSCSAFVVAGQIIPRPVLRDGQVVLEDHLPLRFSYDERIDDGMNARAGIDAALRVLRDPGAELGCLAADGRDARPLGG